MNIIELLNNLVFLPGGDYFKDESKLESKFERKVHPCDTFRGSVLIHPKHLEMDELDDKIAIENVPDEVEQFLLSFSDLQQTITPEIINRLINLLQQQNLSNALRKLICFNFIIFGHYFYKKAFDEIQRLREELKDNLNQDKNLLDSSLSYSPIHYQAIYQRLLILYRLYPYFMLDPSSIPKFHEFQNSIYYQIPYALNVLNLTGKLNDIDVGDLNPDLTIPFQETGRSERQLFKARRGVLQPIFYFKIEKKEKLMVDRSSATAFAVNPFTNETFYIRVYPMQHVGFINTVNRDGIFASKISTRVDPAIFSSEQLMSNGDVCSKTLSTYRRKINTENGNQIDSAIKEKVLPGLGVVDEVCQFARECDSNLENLALSTNELSTAHFSKIDWSEVKPQESLAKAVRFKPLLYGGAESKTYQQETINAKIKLALFTPTLLRLDAEECYETEEKIKQAVCLKTLEVKQIMDEIEKSPHLFSIVVRDSFSSVPLLSREDTGCISINPQDDVTESKQRPEVNIYNIFQEFMISFMNNQGPYLTRKKRNQIIEEVAARANKIHQLIYKNPDPQNDQINVLKMNLINRDLEKDQKLLNFQSKSNELTEHEFNLVVNNYFNYKENSWFSFLKWAFFSSKQSLLVAQQMKGESIKDVNGRTIFKKITSQERFLIAKTYIEKNSKKQFAKELYKVKPELNPIRSELRP